MSNTWIDMGTFHYLIDERFVHAIANELQNPKLAHDYPELRPSVAEVVSALIQDGHLVMLPTAKMIVWVDRGATPEELVTAFFVEALIT